MLCDARITCLYFFLACFLAAAIGLAPCAQASHHADDNSANFKRPKIGLALSGGGARGAAHIGVLKVLEERRIPIDYIAGTSMGSIVGGLYASGMSPEAIAREIEEINWDDVLSDPTPREERSFRRKRDDDLYLIKSRPGIGKDGLKLPSGLIQGQKIQLVLARLTRGAAHIDNFDEFRIPFRAVATDIVTGDEVVLNSGNLATAIRASMSVPAAFAPTVIDERRLVDGGVSNNLPISVVRDMGADIVIAVDISTPLLSDEQVDSVLSITLQLTGLLTRRNTEAQIASLGENDILLVPDLGKFSSTDFSNALQAVPAGRAAAEEQRTELKRLSLAPAQYAQYQASLKQSARTAKQIDFIRINNQSRVKDSILAARVHDSRVGDQLDTDAVERDVGRIFGLELFQNVDYKVLEENGKTGLELSAEERSWGPTYLQFGARYDSNTSGDNIFNVGLAVLATGLNDANGELRFGFQMGDEPAAFANYHQPFGARGMWFASLFAAFQNRLVTIFQGDAATASYGLADAGFEASVGRELGTWGEARVGARYTDGDASVRVGDRSDNPEFVFQRGEWFARLYADELDSFFFPRKGYLASLEWTGSRSELGADAAFDQAQFGGIITKSLGPNTVAALLDYRTAVSGRAPIQSLFRAGGFFYLSGFNRNELSGQHFARAGVAYYRRIESIEFLPVYAGALLEKGNVFDSRDDIGWGNSIYAGSVFIGADTFIGPLSVAYGAAEGGNNSYYVILGRPF